MNIKKKRRINIKREKADERKAYWIDKDVHSLRLYLYTTETVIYTLLQFFVCRNFLDRPFQDYLEWFTARPLACRIFNGYSRTIHHSVRLDTFQGTPP